jgi:hypothetical protein
MAISTIFTLFVVPSIYVLVAARRSPRTHTADQTPAIRRAPALELATV